MPTTPRKTKPASAKSGKIKPAEVLPSPGNPDNQLTELLVAGLRELYWAERHLVLNLPKIQEAAGNNALRKAVADHLKVTKGHVVRLQQAFDRLGLAPLARKCDGLEGLVMEGEGVIDSTIPGSAARLAGLIMACQKVENYEITAYKGLSLLASQLDLRDIAELLEATLMEEQQADTALAQIAQQN